MLRIPHFVDNLLTEGGEVVRKYPKIASAV
jgi:hypothetical protein